ncbi:MAG TPA: hypothetical protein ENK43_13060 [Planctomycetes bacterium]|nr:hypothetical protein [Planctomycetota bacterium]
MNKHLILLIALALALPLSSQTLVESDIFVADRGNSSNGSDGEVRLYSNTGAILGTLPSAGSGKIRGIGVDDLGNAYVARGNEIIRYDAPGYGQTTTVATGTKAQDVAFDPVSGTLWCSFGVNASEATIVQATTGGVVLQTLMDSSLVHPRRLAFGRSGDLYIANVVGNNVIHLDTATGVFQEHVNVASQSATPIGVAVARSKPDRLYVVSDYGTATLILEIDGAPGAGSVTSSFNFGSLTDLTAPSGLETDGSGNLFVANRDMGMNIPGVYPIRPDGSRPVPPYIGSEHINPIDVAFIRRRLDLSLTSSDGTSANGAARVLFGPQQAAITVSLDAPDFPNAVYALFWSDISNTLMGQNCLANPLIDLPIGDGVQIHPLDARRAPILLDSLYFLGIQIIQNGGSGAIPAADPALCPGSVPGTFTFMSGLLDANGHANAQIVFPSLPCPPPVSVQIPLGLIAAVVDPTVFGSQVGLISDHPACLLLEQP